MYVHEAILLYSLKPERVNFQRSYNKLYKSKRHQYMYMYQYGGGYRFMCACDMVKFDLNAQKCLLTKV